MITPKLKDELLKKVLDSGKMRNVSLSPIDVAKELSVDVCFIVPIIKQFEDRALLKIVHVGPRNTEIIITLNANAFDLHRLGGFCAEELYLKAKIETLLLELEQLQPSLPKTLQESCNKVIYTLNTFIQLSSVFLSEPKGF